MLNNWVRFGGTMINMDHVTHITERPNGYTIHMVNSNTPLNIPGESPVGLTLADWLEKQIPPMIFGPEDISTS